MHLLKALPSSEHVLGTHDNFDTYDRGAVESWIKMNKDKKKA